MGLSPHSEQSWEAECGLANRVVVNSERAGRRRRNVGAAVCVPARRRGRSMATRDFRSWCLSRQRVPRRTLHARCCCGGVRAVSVRGQADVNRNPHSAHGRLMDGWMNGWDRRRKQKRIPVDATLQVRTFARYAGDMQDDHPAQDQVEDNSEEGLVFCLADNKNKKK